MNTSNNSPKMEKSSTSLLFIIVFCNFLLGWLTAPAQNPLLLGDINTMQVFPDNSSPIVKSGNSLYFATKLNSEYSLWNSDGTEPGTSLLCSTTTGPLAFFEGNGATSNGIFFFGMNDGYHGYEIWRSDGTQQGTTILKDIVAGEQGIYDLEFIETEDIMYLNIAIAENEYQLWKSDGTEQGTVLINDNNLKIVNSIAFNDKLIFSEKKSNTGLELWITDGTSVGTSLLKDINPGAVDSDPYRFVILNNKVYFFAFQDATGTCLWTTDGTETGTVLVKDFDPVSSDDFYVSEQVTQVIGNKLYIAGPTTSNGYELWVTDGTTAGTKMLEINPGAAGSYPCYFSELGSVLYFSANDGVHGSELWKSDGTGVGTQLVKDINPGAQDSGPGASNLNLTGIFSVNNHLYFRANDGVHGGEPWKSDGTPAGTSLLYDMATGTPESTPGYFLSTGSKVVFIDIIGGGTNLWTTDGTTQGTISISNAISNISEYLEYPILLNNQVYFSSDGNIWYTDGTVTGTQQLNFATPTTASSYPANMVKLADHSYLFSADDGINGSELWFTNGNFNETSLLKDIYPGSNSSDISMADVVIDGKIFFRATETSGTGLWVTNGTEEGTIKIADCDPIFDEIHSYVELNKALYFVAGSNSYQQELWRSNGTVAGTYQVSFISTNNAEVKDLTLSNAIIYFHARGSVGRDLYKSDGTTAGTQAVTSSDVSPREITAYNGKVYFRGHGVNSDELWMTDGTAGGTFIVKENGGPENPANLKVVGDHLYFSAIQNIQGECLWKTDGTASGTVVIKDINPSGQDALLNFFTDINGMLFFRTGEEDNGVLWKSDGSDAGTIMIMEFNATISQLHNVNDDLYFIKDDNNNNVREMWRTDGTECHTQPIDLILMYSDETEILLVDGSTLFLSLLAQEYGEEPWKYETTPIGNIEICNGFDDDCDGVIDNNPIATINPSENITECKGVPVTLSAEFGINLSYQWLKNGNAIAGATNNSHTTKQAGDFQVAVNNSFTGCNATSPVVNINRLDNPTAVITPLGNLDICPAGFVGLKANIVADASYQWYFNNNPIPGAISPLYHATMVSYYKVKVTNSLGCEKFSKKIHVIESCRQLNSSEDNWLLNIYPNPTTGILKIKQEKLNSGTLVIKNLIGETMIIQPFNSSEVTVDVTSFARGIYLLHLQTDTETFTRKFEKL